ncbi:MAG: hypothetical protein MJ053_07020 [Elusimicrobiaceae bacterium]|nr:hypothetical protein [Elusimicrobiaceae bacterium]
MNWIHTNAKEILAAIGAVVTAASLIVKLTPTPKDDALLAKIIRVLSALSLCNADGSFIGKKDA